MVRTIKILESSFEATEGNYAEFGNKLFSDYEYFLKIKLNEDYGDKGFCEDKFIGTYDGEYSEFTYNGRPFKTRKQFEKILAQSQNQN